MPRPYRFNLLDVSQYVIQRRDNRDACFFDADDYRFSDIVEIRLPAAIFMLMY